MPQQQELAAVNTVATLTELCQFHRPGSVFPGDPACGLKPREAGERRARRRLSDSRAAKSFRRHTDRSGQRPRRRVPHARHGDPRRQHARSLPPRAGETPGLRLRSFGLYQFGFAHDKMLDNSVSRICRAVVQRLSGPQPAARSEESTRCSTTDLATRPASRRPIRSSSSTSGPRRSSARWASMSSR